MSGATGKGPASGIPAKGKGRGGPAKGGGPLFHGPYWKDGLSESTREFIAQEGLVSRPGQEGRGYRHRSMFTRKDAAVDVRGALGAELRTRRKSSAEERMSLHDWALRVPEPKTGNLDFGRYPFQVEMYTEGALEREMVVQKCSQVGISAWLLRWAMYWADMRSLTSLYVFPKLKQMYDFSDARIQASIVRSEFLLTRIPPRSVQNKGLKQIGGGFVYFRGSESEDDLESVDADVLALDEYDRLTPENVPVAEKRIAASQLGLVRRVGVPTIPGYGISRLYGESDGRRWMVRCRCGHESALSWGENVDVERRVRMCAKCSKELRDVEVAAGRWAAEHPDAETRGYALNRLVVPQAKMTDLVGASRGTLPEQRQSFWNRDMGEPYSPASGRLSLEAIRAAQSAGERMGVHLVEHYSGGSHVTMGVDVASKRNLMVRISARVGERRKRALWIGEVDSFERLDELMDRYNVHLCGIDHQPEYRSAMAFAERFPGRVMLVRYSSGLTKRVFTVDEAAREVAVRRTDAIDAAFDAVRAQRNLLPPELPERYAENLQSLQRIVEDGEGGRQNAKYVKTARDDYAHAEVYDTVAWEVFLWRAAVEGEVRESYSRLEDHLEFDRSVLHEEGDRYVEGLGAEYSEGGSSGRDVYAELAEYET